MSPAFPLTSLASAYAGAKARQIRRDAILYGFIGLMALVVCLALFSAFAVFVAQSHGLLNGLLASAGLAVVLALFALGIRSLLRRRARRRMATTMATSATALSLTTASGLISRNKTAAILTGIVLGAVAGSMVRSERS
ncbi:MAG: hypothetical protein KI789_07735 [Hoeflea sp.]|nr:hypothetical protein [Hoeflea sp.]